MVSVSGRKERHSHEVYNPSCSFFIVNTCFITLVLHVTPDKSHHSQVVFNMNGCVEKFHYKKSR